jgi:hypothetical protein
MEVGKMKTTIALILSILAYTASAQEPGPSPLLQCEKRLTACDGALNAAQGVMEAQDASIRNLKAANKELADRLADSQSGQLLPGWAWLAIGAAAGIATYSIVRAHSVP